MGTPGTARPALRRAGQRVVAVGSPVPLRQFGHDLARRTVSRNGVSAASPRRRCSSSVRSGTSPNLPGRLFTVTIADFWSSFAGGWHVQLGLVLPPLGSATALVTIAGPSSGTASASAAGACSGRSR